jgi:uncharacterized protein GlcG (DUF336 family)
VPEGRVRGVLIAVALLLTTHLFAVPDNCTEGGAAFSALSSAEVDAMVKAAAASTNINTLTIAVVDRAGRPLALYRKPAANPANDDLAIGVARTGAFFSHNMAPLSSRTVRFISGIHFPPGVTNTPNAALYGIENTNRGCDMNLALNPGKSVAQGTSLNGNPCSAVDQSGCGTGIVTGKVQPDDRDASAVNPGGIPIYRAGNLAGGIGVIGADDPDVDEYAAVSGVFGALSPVPQFPLPEPGNVYIDGIRLPFLSPNARLTATGLERPDGITAGVANGAYVVGPIDGGCASNEYIVGPNAGSKLSQSEVDAIVQRAISASKRTRAAIRLPLNRYVRMVIAVADLDGTILALYRMPDATVFSIDVAVAKARNVIYFSGGTLPGVSNGVAVSNRTIGFGAQPLYPPGIDSKVLKVAPGPFYQIFLDDLAKPCGQGGNGIVFFAGSSPLYRNGSALVGGLGVSGDGVEQDDYVTYLAAGDFLPNQKIWADHVTIKGVRLPMFKFPRHPEGVTECGGKPCG